VLDFAHGHSKESKEEGFKARFEAKETCQPEGEADQSGETSHESGEK
jgi:hypothetical protein